MTEPEAVEKFGKDDLKIYNTSVSTRSFKGRSLPLCSFKVVDMLAVQFKAMSFAMLNEEDKQPTSYKLICQGPNEKVVGLHIIGEGSDEMLQGC